MRARVQTFVFHSSTLSVWILDFMYTPHHCVFIINHFCCISFLHRGATAKFHHWHSVLVWSNLSSQDFASLICGVEYSQHYSPTKVNAWTIFCCWLVWNIGIPAKQTLCLCCPAVTNTATMQVFYHCQTAVKARINYAHWLTWPPR